MITRLRQLRLRINRDDAGVALVAVIGIAAVVMILATTALVVSTSGMTKARTIQDSRGALAAAYAGVEEYATRLSSDSTYVKYGNPSAPFSIETDSASLVSLPSGDRANPAFGLGDQAWAKIPGSVGEFRYEVDNSLYSRSGAIRVRATGKVGTATQSVIANLKQKGFLDFLYFTDIETMDPQFTSLSCVPMRATGSGSSIGHASNCLNDGKELQFGANDVFDGPVHSNDFLVICSTTFKRGVTTSSTLTSGAGAAKKTGWKVASGCSNPKPAGTIPGAGEEHPLPLTNQEMITETKLGLADVPRPGCLYTGPTTITFTSAGKMRVKSPWTQVTNPSAIAAVPNESLAQCGVPGSGRGNLGSSEGQELNVLDSNLIYVQNVPTVRSDPNYRAGIPSGFSCTGSGASSGWKFGSGDTATGYPVAGERIPSTSTSVSPAYACRNGDAFVQGTVKGAITIATQNYLYVTGDIKYKDAAVDVLGLVGQNAVWVWNPMDSDERSKLTGDNRQIEAAILSVAHTFQVQNHDKGASSEGNRGTLKIHGAVAQKFRGPVGTSSDSRTVTGYEKSYVYDDRLRETAPPKFLTPTSTTYGVTQYSDTPSAFKPDGSAR